MNFEKKLKCKSCQYKKNISQNGNCLIKKGADGLPVMCVGDWAAHKHYYLERYLDLFYRAMTKSWGGNLYYIDMFCGPGRCILRETEEEVDGSPLIALKFKFAGYVFVDIEKDNITALRQRSKSRTDFNKVTFLREDCNKATKPIRTLIPENSLSVALIDPFGLDFDFSSYIELTRNRKIDLIINFPLGTAIKRNLSRLNYEKSKLNKFLGGTDWQPVKENQTSHFINYFKRKLEGIGYKIPWESQLSSDVVIKTIKKKVPLYYLLFASKNLLGSAFWKKIGKYDPSGQSSMF